MQIQHFLRRQINKLSGSALSFIFLSGIAAEMSPAIAEIVIAPHRAAYTLTLKRTGRDSAISNANGAMVYSWGETCDGWTVDQQFVLNVVQGDGRAVQLNARSSTWESKDGKRLRFNIKRERNGAEVEKIRGEGRLKEVNGAGVAKFKFPQVKTIPLPKGTVFPTRHTLKLMQLAQEGKMTDRQLVFDGSDLELPGPVTAFILPLKQPKAPNKALEAPLGPNKIRTFNLAFFNADPKRTEPEFEMSIQLQDNGIAPSMVLDYGGYAVQGELAQVNALEKPDC